MQFIVNHRNTSAVGVVQKREHRFEHRADGRKDACCQGLE